MDEEKVIGGILLDHRPRDEHGDEDDDAHDECQRDEENEQCIEDDVEGGRW